MSLELGERLDQAVTLMTAFGRELPVTSAGVGRFRLLIPCASAPVDPPLSNTDNPVQEYSDHYHVRPARL